MSRTVGLAALGALLLARLLFAAHAGLAADEAYYWQWARHLDWGYYDHPPMVAYGIAAGRALVGDSQLGVRLVSVVLSTAVLPLVFALGRRRGGSDAAGWWAAACAAAAPLLAAGGALATPDIPVVFFWTASLVVLLRALRTGHLRNWLLLGGVVGLGGASKYTMILIAPSLGLALLASPRGRAALRGPGPYAAAALALLLCAPLLAWILGRGGESVLYQLTQGFGEAGGKPRDPLRTGGEFVGVQALVVTPLLFAGGVYALGRAARELVRAAAQRAAAAADPERLEVLGVLVVPASVTLLVFAAASLLQKSYANWVAAAWPAIFALLGAELAGWQRDWRSGRRRGLRLAAIAGLGMGALVTLHLHVEAIRPLAPYPRGALTRVRDHSDFAAWAQRTRAARGDAGLAASVLASNYQTASLLAFYLPDRPETDAPFERRGGSQYNIWRERSRGDAAAQPAHGLYFSTNPRERASARARELLRAPELVDTYVIERRGRELETVLAFFGERRGRARRAKAAKPPQAVARVADARSDRRDPAPGAPREGAAPGRAREDAGAGRWRRHVPPAPVVPRSPEERAMIERLEAIGYVDGSAPAPDRSGVTRHERGRAQAGLNFYTSGHAPEAVLMDMDGRVLHRWHRDFASVLPGARLPPGARGHAHWRRARLLPGGELLAIFEGLALVKLDRDSKLLWVYDGRPHHDVQRTPDGDIVTLTRRVVRDPSLNGGRPVLVDYLTRLDARGRPLAEISLLEAYRSSPYAADLERVSQQAELFHSNALQVLDGSHAGLSDAFRAGNLLVSILMLDAIAVIDPDAGRVVWRLAGGWDKQHEPVFTPEGRVVLFDNQRDTRRDASRVVEFDPIGNRLAWEYAGGRDGPLRSATCGTAQRLANGNTLITESDNGRAFEVTPDKQIVWEWVSPHRAGDDGELIATLFEMRRLDASSPTDWLPE